MFFNSFMWWCWNFFCFMIFWVFMCTSLASYIGAGSGSRSSLRFLLYGFLVSKWWFNWVSLWNMKCIFVVVFVGVLCLVSIDVGSCMKIFESTMSEFVGVGVVCIACCVVFVCFFVFCVVVMMSVFVMLLVVFLVV